MHSLHRSLFDALRPGRICRRSSSRRSPTGLLASFSYRYREAVLFASFFYRFLHRFPRRSLRSSLSLRCSSARPHLHRSFYCSTPLFLRRFLYTALHAALSAILYTALYTAFSTALSPERDVNPDIWLLSSSFSTTWRPLLTFGAS
jgi:hypothetical protein